MLRLSSNYKKRLTEKKKMKKCSWILINLTILKSNFFYNTSRKSMKNTQNNSPFPKNISIKLFSKRTLSNLETRFAFSNNLRMATMTMKTKKEKPFR